MSFYSGLCDSERELFRTMGRPRMPYDHDIALRVCERIAHGENLSRINKDKSFPISSVTILKWISENPIFESLYTKAREQRADARNERIDDYREAALSGKIPPEVARIAIDSEKWQASKENPRRYGDRTILAGDKDNPLELLAVRLDKAIETRKVIDVTPTHKAIGPAHDDNDLL